MARWKASDQSGAVSDSPDLKVVGIKRIHSLVTKALFVRLEARPSTQDAVENFLVWARLLVAEEPGTETWLAVRFDASTFGIIESSARVAIW